MPKTIVKMSLLALAAPYDSDSDFNSSEEESKVVGDMPQMNGRCADNTWPIWNSTFQHKVKGGFPSRIVISRCLWVTILLWILAHFRRNCSSDLGELVRTMAGSGSDAAAAITLFKITVQSTWVLLGAKITVFYWWTRLLLTSRVCVRRERRITIQLTEGCPCPLFPNSYHLVHFILL